MRAAHPQGPCVLYSSANVLCSGWPELPINSESAVQSTSLPEHPRHPNTSHTTKVRRHNVLAGARGSRAACKSQTLIFLQGKMRLDLIKVLTFPTLWTAMTNSALERATTKPNGQHAGVSVFELRLWVFDFKKKNLNPPRIPEILKGYSH